MKFLVYFGRQREAVMQEFKFHNKRICGVFPAFPPKRGTVSGPQQLEGFFVWDAHGIYECRPKVCYLIHF